MIIDDSFRKRTLEDFKSEIYEDNKVIMEEYCLQYEAMISRHPQYNSNWRASFLDPHRYMNWIVYSLLKKEAQNSIVIDIGIYDSCLLKTLNDNGIKCYGYEDNDWGEMYDLLGTRDMINTQGIKADIAVCLNYAHNFNPDDLILFIQERCAGSLPTILLDQDSRVTNMHSDLYYKSARDGMFDLIRFNNCKERDLFVYKGGV
tara:strand:+ start:3347 stop:3955 length:609 start_codon:yes stop_codon:yes gene_type:complete